jgi:hypothetical protein
MIWFVANIEVNGAVEEDSQVCGYVNHYGPMQVLQSKGWI